MTLVFLGPIVHSKSLKELEIITNGFLAVDSGKIVGIGKRSECDKFLESYKFDKEPETIVLRKSQFLLPGFIDCHIHAPQMPNVGLGYDKPLLDWLETYTFPMESEFKDTKLAKENYSKTIEATLRSGTTLATYYATNYKDSTVILAEEAIRQGQRAFIGKVSSNINCPDFYIEKTDESVRDNIEVIQRILDLKNDLVQPIITPRFAISCNMELMKQLAVLANKHDLNVQTHISENAKETEFARELYNTSYAGVYEEAGLLKKKCILAHGVFLTDTELALLNKKETAVAHCPASNSALKSGLCDVKRLLAHGIRVGLGTDCSGGNRICMLDIIRDALTVSTHLGFIKQQEITGTGRVQPDSKWKWENEKFTPLHYKEALYLATLGGAEALAVEDKVGNFVVGKRFDALLIDTAVEPIYSFQYPYALWEGKSDEEKIIMELEEFLYSGDDRNIINVYVDGNLVK